MAEGATSTGWGASWAASPAAFATALSAWLMRGVNRLRMNISDARIREKRATRTFGCSRKRTNFPMISHFRHTITFAALALLLAARCSHAADVAAVPALDASPITSLTYAPDGKSLWSVNINNQLTVRANDDKAEIYRGKLPAFTSMLRVLKDGSFLAGTSDCALDWFEPPRAGEPLKLRREFDGLEARGIKKRANPALKDTATDEEKMAAINNLRFNDLVVAPDEKRVAYSLLKSEMWSGIIYDTPTQEVIRVLNLESGQIESEQIVVMPTLSVPKKGSDTSGLSSIHAIRPDRSATKLAWADAQTLVVARGLSLERFDMAGKKLSEWKPLDAPQALGRANVLVQEKYLAMSPAELNILVKTAQPLPFDVAAQKIVALSADGTQLVVSDNRKLVTLWNSTTGEARILSENTAFVPFYAHFSPDGARVAAWDTQTVRAWYGKSRMSIPARENAPIWDVALSNERIALARGTDVWSIRFLSDTLFPPGPTRLEDLRAAR